MEKSLWQYIFNGALSIQNVTECAEKARMGGYPLFSWNGAIYRVPKSDENPLSQSLHPITVEDIS